MTNERFSIGRIIVFIVLSIAVILSLMPGTLAYLRFGLESHTIVVLIGTSPIIIAVAIIYIMYATAPPESGVVRQERKTESFDVFLPIERKMTPDEFFLMRKKHGTVDQDLNFPGVYVLLNETKKMHYVGQSATVADRVNLHFTGKGKGDVYADYKYGDRFVIRLIRLKKSGYGTLNDLESEMIRRYDAFGTGYNKTRGNK